jgi:hypothetical protein
LRRCSKAVRSMRLNGAPFLLRVNHTPSEYGFAATHVCQRCYVRSSFTVGRAGSMLSG